MKYIFFLISFAWSTLSFAIDFTRCQEIALSALDGGYMGFGPQGIGRIDDKGNIIIDSLNPDFISKENIADDTIKINYKVRETLYNTPDLKRIDGVETVYIKKDTSGRIISISHGSSNAKILAKNEREVMKKRNQTVNDFPIYDKEEVLFQYSGDVCEVKQLLRTFDNSTEVIFDRELCNKLNKITENLTDLEIEKCETYFEQFGDILSDANDKFSKSGMTMYRDKNPAIQAARWSHQCRRSYLGYGGFDAQPAPAQKVKTIKTDK